MFTKRSLVSFSGPCKLQCKHCYTFSKECSSSCTNDFDECETLLERIDDNSDIVYISHDRENFINEKAGCKLASAIFNEKKKSIFIITRCVLSDECVNELAELNIHMRDEGLNLVVAVSIPAMESIYLLERKELVSSPEERIDLLRRLHEKGIKTILMIRPLLPNSIIPIEEAFQLIKLSENYIDAVVSSGLAVNAAILDRLGFSDYSFDYMPGENAEFLIGAEVPDIKYVDTEKEIASITNYCNENNIIFHRHSLDALNAIL